MKKFLALLPSFILIAVLTFGQSPVTSTVPNQTVVPSSPDAASLGRYGEIPVGLYTGVPNISIPIYTIKLKGLELPITLSYHAAGIKVDQYSGSVGTNWTLNFGGSITMGVNGIPDLQAGAHGFPGVSDTVYVPQTTDYQTSWTNAESWWLNGTYMKLLDASNEVYDTQPDMYYLNYNNKSLRFLFEQGGIGATNIRTIPYSMVGINGDVNGFDVYGEDNNTYSFHSVESSYTTYLYNNGGQGYNTRPHHNPYYNYTYYPSSIVTPSGDAVTYEYEHYSYSFNNQTSVTRYSSPTYNPGASGGPAASNYTASSTLVYYGLRVSKIKTSKGLVITFCYGKNRYSPDLDSTKALTKITVRDSINNRTISTDTLMYDYALGADRLTLDSVRKDKDNPYKFIYTGSPAPVLSTSQDHWGYTNGSAAYDPAKNILPIDPIHGFTTGTNRDPNSSALGGLLTQITYPTGGNTVFTYEPNDALTVQDKSSSHYAEVDGVIGNQNISVPLTITSHGTTGSYRAFYSCGDGFGSYTDPTAGPVSCTVTLKPSGGGTGTTFGPANGAGGDPLLLSPGSYVLNITTHFAPGVDFSSVFARIEWSQDSTVSENTIVGGARIKTITSNPVSGLPVVKHYEYTDPANPAISSGAVNWNPSYSYIRTIQQPTVSDPSVTVPVTYMAQGASSVSPLGSIQGGAVGYTNVTEYTTSKNHGYSVSSFTPPYVFTHPYPEFMPVYPFAPIIDYDWEEGLLLQKTDYKWTTGGFIPVKRVNNTYLDTINNPHGYKFRAMKVVLETPGVAPGGLSSPVGPVFNVQYYNLPSYTRLLSESTETTYDSSDTTKKAVTDQKYFYANPYHLQVTRQEITRSNGEKYHVDMRYPGDIFTTDNVPSAAADGGVLPPLEKRVIIDNGTTKRMVRDEVTLYNNAILPTAYYSLKNMAAVDSSTVAWFDGSTISSSLEKRMNYCYDESYNVATETKDSLQNTGYQWGYNEQYPVAACKNALNTEFYTQNFEEPGAGGTSPASAAHTGDKYYSGSSYTVSWTRPNSRAYLIDYWYHDAATGFWKYKRDSYTGSYTLTGGDRYDDIRVYPIDAQIATYTYIPFAGMSSAIDAKGQVTSYEYDSEQRLMNIKDQYGNIVKHMDYHYQGQ